MASRHFIEFAKSEGLVSYKIEISGTWNYHDLIAEIVGELADHGFTHIEIKEQSE